MNTIATLTKRAKTPEDTDEWMVSIDGFVTTYSKGTGLRQGHKMPMRPTVWDMEQFNNPRQSRTVDPTEKEVIAALASDASLVADYPDLDSFASEFCQGMTVSQAVESYNGCMRAVTFFISRGLNFRDYLFVEEGGATN